MNTRKILIPSAIFVTLVTFVYLYIGLHALAVSYIGLESLPAILFPFAIDAATLVFLVAALDHRVKGKHYLFVWCCVVLLSGVSVVAQYIAHPGTEDTALAPWLASVPAATLIFLTHLLWIIAQDAIVVGEKREVMERLTDGEPVSMLGRAVEVMRTAEVTEEKVTGSTMAQALGLLKENGAPHITQGNKWIGKAKEAMASGV